MSSLRPIRIDCAIIIEQRGAAATATMQVVCAPLLNDDCLVNVYGAQETNNSFNLWQTCGKLTDAHLDVYSLPQSDTKLVTGRGTSLDAPGALLETETYSCR